MWHYVYILKNQNGSQYVGHTDNIEARLMEHNEGSVIATKNKRPWEVEWFCAYKNPLHAIPDFRIANTALKILN